MILPLAEIVGLSQQGVGNLLRETGLSPMPAVKEEEVRHLAGGRHEQHEEWRAHRWGKEDGYSANCKTPYAMTDYSEAKRALATLYRELMDLNPSAPRSLGEGLEETLTVPSCVSPISCRTLCCTNVIESAFSIVETVCRNVKRWQPGDQIERWVGSGLLVEEF